MYSALPGSCNMFGRLQNAISVNSKTMVDLSKSVHQALDDFTWIANNITTQPTRLAELIPLTPSVEGHHDASGKGDAGAWFPSNTLQFR